MAINTRDFSPEISRTFWSLKFGFPQVSEGRGGFGKVRKAERKQIQEISSKTLRGIPSYDQKKEIGK